MKRATESRGYVSADSQTPKWMLTITTRIQPYLESIKPHVSFPTQTTPSVTEITDAIAEYGSTSELPV